MLRSFFEKSLGPSLVLLALVWLMYYPVLGYGFIHFDDHLYITHNPFVSQGLTWAGVHWAFFSLGADNWIPLTWLSHMLDVQLFGLNAGAHHAVNVLLHSANAVLVFVLFDALSGRRILSWGIALIFALHPLHVESVAWIAERKDVLSAFFILLALWSYSQQKKQEASRRTVLYFTQCLVFFALSLISKPMYVTFPFILMIFDFWPLGRLQSWRDVLKSAVEKIPFFLMATAAGFVTLYVQKNAGAVFDWQEIEPGHRMLSVFMAVSNYVQKFLYPSHLSIFYPAFSAKEIAAWGSSTFMVLAGISMVILIGFVRRYPWVLASWLLFWVALFPVLGLVKAGTQAYADRYTYFSYIGLSILFVWALDLWSEKNPKLKNFFLVGFILWLAFCCLQSTLRVREWSSTERLFLAAAQVHPHNYVAHKVLADDAYARGDLPKASDYLEQALKVLPLEAESIRGEYELNLAVVYQQRQDWEKAMEFYQKASERMPLRADLVVAIGDVHMQLNQPALARLQYEKALKWMPGNEDIQKKLAEARRV